MYLDNIAGDNNKEGYQDLSSMCLDKKHRKLYLGDIDGVIRCFNVSTGLCIKSIEPSREMMQKVNEYTSKVNKEVVSLKYFSMSEEINMLVSGHWNSRIRIWDETQGGDGVVHMRTSSSERQFQEDVQSIAISEHHSMIATGGQYGTIILWDFELFKVIGVLIGSKMAITAIEFVETYPLLVSVGQCGIISVYAIRGAPNAIRCMCLARFLNIGMEFSAHKNIPITSAFIEVRKNLEYNPLTRRMSELAQTLSFFKTALPEGEEDMNKFSKNMFDHKMDRSVEIYKTSFNTTEVMKEVVDGEVQSPKQPKSADPEEGFFLNSDHEGLFPRYHPSFGNSENPYYLNLVLSDVQRNIKWLDLSAFIRRPAVEEISVQKNEAE